MAGDRARKRLGQLARLADLAAQRSAADLRLKQAQQTRLTDLLRTIEQPPELSPDGQLQFSASGAAESWKLWQAKERGRLAILTARARLAADAARKTHARAEARRHVLYRIAKQKQ